MYSQNDEELTILQHLGDSNGFFLDIGAYDGVTMSNTRALAEAGWSGALVEGSSFPFTKLFSVYGGNQRMTLINAMVARGEAGNNRIVKMWESPNSALSTIEQENFDKWNLEVARYSEGGVGFSEIYVPTVSIREILDVCESRSKTIDFVSIDIEGGSSDVAMQIDPDRFSVKMLCVEHDGRHVDLINHFSKYRFLPILLNAENLILFR